MQQMQLLLHRRLHRLARTPPQMILPLRPPPPLRRDRIQPIIVILLFAIALLLGAAIQLELLQIRLVEAEVARFEPLDRTRWSAVRSGTGPLGRHLLPRLVLVPLLARRLPLDQRVGVARDDVLVEQAVVEDGGADEGVHVELLLLLLALTTTTTTTTITPDTLGALAEELEDALDPAHELVEEAVVVAVDLVHEFIKVVLVPGAEVDEGLHCLVRIGGDVLSLRRLDDLDGVVGELGEVGDGAVHVGGFVHAHEGFVEDGEEVAEELEGGGLKEEKIKLVGCSRQGWAGQG